MSEIYTEWLDQNLHRVYPLQDDMTGQATNGNISIPTKLMSDIFLCVPNHPSIDIELFYISNITVRSRFIDISIGYEGVSDLIGSFSNIDMTASVHTTYLFTPLKQQTGDITALLFHITGQITMGELSALDTFIGSWNFDINTARITPTRMSEGLINVQYISVNDRLYSGTVRLLEGDNIELTAEEETIGGLPVTTITVSASLNSDSAVQLNNDEDVIDALVARFGRPLRTINGLLSDVDRNFRLEGADCTDVEDLTTGVVISNPCATPCCDEDENIADIQGSIANLNLRYAQLKASLDSGNREVTDLQNKFLSLGAGTV